jgi:hypothetical protein
VHRVLGQKKRFACEILDSGVYCDTLKNLCRAIHKRSGMLSRGVLMLHDNARPHIAAVT